MQLTSRRPWPAIAFSMKAKSWSCIVCALKGGKHRDHDYEELAQAFKKYNEEITPSLEPMEPMEHQIAVIKKVLARLNAHCGKISDQRAATADNIHTTFRRLQEVLSVRETELISQLDQITQGKLKGLAAQRDQIETTLAQFSSCLHFVRESLRTGNERDVLLMKTNVNTVEKVKELTTSFQPHMLEPITEADIVFSTSTDMALLWQNYGQVYAPHSPDPLKCCITGKGAEVAAVREKCIAILQAINFKGEPCHEPIKVLECTLTSEITGATATCGVERRGLSQYEISYQPTVKGKHQLHIKAEGQHIRGSPFSIAVKLPVKMLGTPIVTINEMDGPWGVAINERGEVMVTESEWGGHCVSVFSQSGKKIRSFGTKGYGLGQFRNPHGVAVDGDGNVLVVDTHTHRIQKFTAEGNFLTAVPVGSMGSGRLQLVCPIDLAFNASNCMVYVVDANNHCVQVLNSDLAFSSTFGKKGSGKGQFCSPRGIACDSTGKVYVADRDNYRIQVFTAEGKFLKTLGRRQHGQGREELGRPVGVAIDASDMVYVSEWDDNCVSVFTSEGQFVTSFGREGVRPGEFRYPCGLAVDDCGVVYVCDNNRLQMF